MAGQHALGDLRKSLGTQENALRWPRTESSWLSPLTQLTQQNFEPTRPPPLSDTKDRRAKALVACLELRLLSNHSTTLCLSFIWVMKSMPRTRAADRNVVSMKNSDLDEEYLRRKVHIYIKFPT
jgi:hypothetical protein